MPYKSVEDRKACQRRWYDRPGNKAKVLKANIAGRQRLRDYVRAYKAKRGCRCCGTKIAIVLDLHHRDPKDKTRTIADLCGRRVSLPKLHEEMDKCDIVCANCHRIEHWEAGTLGLDLTK